MLSTNNLMKALLVFLCFYANLIITQYCEIYMDMKDQYVKNISYFFENVKSLKG